MAKAKASAGDGGDDVVFLNPTTCGIYKDGGARYKIDQATASGGKYIGSAVVKGRVAMEIDDVDEQLNFPGILSPPLYAKVDHADAATLCLWQEIAKVAETFPDAEPPVTLGLDALALVTRRSSATRPYG